MSITKLFIFLIGFFLLDTTLLEAQNTSFEKIFGDADKRSVGVASVSFNNEFIFLVGYESKTGEDTEGTLSKLDFQGNLLWTYTFGTRNNDIPRDIILNDNEELVIVGESQTNGATQVSAFLFVFDTSGIELRSKTYDDDTKNVFFNNIKQTRDDGYIICGNISGQGFGNDYYILKTDKNGTKEWDQSYGDLNNEIGIAIEVMEDGSYVFVGDKQQSTQGPYGIEITSIDSVGTINWQSDINDFANGGCKSMIRNSAGNFVIVGEATPPNQIAFDVFIAEVAVDGQLIWQNFIEATPNSDAGFGIIEVPNEASYMVTGYGHNELTNETDIVVSELNSSGDEQRRLYYEKPGSGIGYDIKLINDNSFLVTGFVTEGNTSKYFLALNQFLSTSTSDRDTKSLNVELYPNPISPKSHLLQVSPFVRDAKVSVVNSNGITVLEMFSNILSSIDLSSLNPGVYWVNIQTANGFLNEKIILL